MGSLRPATWRLEEMEEVPSTQDVARSLADDGAPEGTVIVAGVQSAGRGRAGRIWSSPKGGLYMSIILRPPNLPNTQLLSLVGTLSVVRGVKSSVGIDSSIRWPNDVLIRGGKVSGIIVESSYSGQTLSAAVLGIGVNCNNRTAIMGHQSMPAASLMEELHGPVDIAQVRGGILDSLQSVYSKWVDGSDIRRDVETFMGTLGRRVLVKTKAGREITCTAVGLDASGALIAKDGLTTMTFHGEDVEHLTELGPSPGRQSGQASGGRPDL